ncbi:hypothetical protein HKX48_003162 [Thoreauomyces humboldtii]|nr:hypothetical protein HKX48_003162 [Thoreauomyces humboldtii]
MTGTPTIPSYEPLGAGQTLSTILTLPVVPTTNVAGVTWPADVNPGNCAVIDGGLRLFNALLNNDAVIHELALHCTPVGNLNNPTIAKLFDYRAAVQNTTPAAIRAHILTHMPTITVGPTPTPHVFMETVLLTGPCNLIIARSFVRECAQVNAGNDERRKLWLTVRVKLMHEIAHVLMYKVGFNNTLQPDGRSFRTPGGIMKKEAGNAFECFVFGGVLQNLTHLKYTTYAASLLEDEEGERFTIPVSWGVTMLSGAFWAGTPSFFSPLGANSPGRRATDVQTAFKKNLIMGNEVLQAGTMNAQTPSDSPLLTTPVIPEGAAATVLT